MGDVLGRLWMVFFSWGGAGGEEETPGHGLLSLFRASRKVPSTSTPWTDVSSVQVSTTRRPLPHTEDSEGTAAPRSTTDSTDQWVW
jgi:hypothetical protein